MSKPRALGYWAVFVLGWMVAVAGVQIGGWPAPQETQTTLAMDSTRGNDVMSFTFDGPGDHTTPAFYGVRVHTRTTLIDAPEKVVDPEPETEPMESLEAVGWAVFVMVCLFCAALALGLLAGVSMLVMGISEAAGGDTGDAGAKQ